MKMTLITLCFLFINTTLAQDWSEHATLPGKQKCLEFGKHTSCFSSGNRENIYELATTQLKESIRQGSQHALHYPVKTTKLSVPYDILRTFFEEQPRSILKRFVYRILKKSADTHSLDDIYKWVGTHPYPKSDNGANPNLIYNPYRKLEKRMGATIFERDGIQQLTFSCAACHSANLFGTKVMGMTNRFPRANEFFSHGKKLLDAMPRSLFKMATRPNSSELKVFEEAKNAVAYIGVKKPLVLGLDTSLAQVALSLEKRALDEYATRVPTRVRYKNKLNKVPADSKPAVWWNLKYKTKWLSDASIDSGNPVHTNFLWNEIGRGADLKELEGWLTNNVQKIKDLTSYVFASKAPKYEDFFPDSIDINLAKKGEKLFLKNCAGCHGIYEKQWYGSDQSKLATKRVWYHTQTKVIDVGTDPYRYQGMKYFAEDLNRLKISKTLGAVVTHKKGYVPPPLVGIWARWPYFHNNSAPTLLDVLTPDTLRPKVYYAREAIDKERDFDKKRNGYPRKKNSKLYKYDTSRAGMSNKGHTKMLLNKDGSERYTQTQKMYLIEFLKTL